MDTLQKSFNATHALTIAAGETLPVAVMGRRLYFTSATAPFQFNIGDGQWQDFEQGLGLVLPAGDNLTQLQFRHAQAVPVQIKFHVGSIEIIDLRPFQTPATVLVGRGQLTLEPHKNVAPFTDRLTFFGISNGLRRKQIVISNSYQSYSATLYLGIYVGGVKFANLIGGASMALETDQDIEIRNESASFAINPTVGEIFYE